MFVRSYFPGDENTLIIRIDMAAEFQAERRLPDGPKWSLCDAAGMVRAIGGYEAGVSFDGWLLPGEGLTARHWACIAARAREVMAWLKAAEPGRMIWVRVSPLPKAETFIRHLNFRPSATQGEFYYV